MGQGPWKDVNFEEEEYGAVLDEQDQLNRLHFQREQEREGARNAPFRSVKLCDPSVDRAKTDPRNLLGVVMEEEDGFYRIGTDHGILSQQYSRNQFEPSSSQFVSKEKRPGQGNFATH